MTQEEKELLLKDLCGRLPYGVNITDGLHTVTLKADNIEKIAFKAAAVKQIIDSGHILPYLRPISKMTKKEREEYRKFSYYGAIGIRNEDFTDTIAVPSFEKLDYLNSHHFDYRGLIEKGLALEASEELYNT